MRFMMIMIPKVYQPDAPPGEKAGEGFAPSAETVARMMKFNEELAKVGADHETFMDIPGGVFESFRRVTGAAPIPGGGPG